MCINVYTLYTCIYLEKCGRDEKKKIIKFNLPVSQAREVYGLASRYCVTR